MVDVRHRGDELRRRVGARVGGVEAVHVREQHQQRGAEEVRHHRREVIVVAELDLGDRNRVVLVDDREGVVLEEGADRVADVQVAGAAVEVAGGEEDLRRVDAVRGEALLVELHERRLADRRARLELRQVGGALAEPELADAGADGPAGDEHAPPAGGADAVELLGERPDAVGVEPPGGVGEDVGADLDDDRVRPRDDVLTDRIGHDRVTPGRHA